MRKQRLTARFKTLLSPTFLWGIAALLLHLPLCFFPLTQSPGYESALFSALFISLAAGQMAAVLPGRIQQQRAPFPGAQYTVLRLYGMALKPAIALLALVAALGLLNTLRVPPCNLRIGAWFFLLMPVGAAFFSAALGLFWGLLAKPCLAKYLWPLLWLAVLFLALLDFYYSAAVFVFHPFFGWFPGPLYDRAIDIPLALFFYRGHNAAWIALMLLIAHGFIDIAALRLRLRRPRWTKGQAGAAVTLLVLLCLSHALAHRAGWRTRTAALAIALPQVTQAGPLILHFPAAAPPQFCAQTTADAAHSLRRIEDFFGIDVVEPVRVFFFHNAAHRKKLTGAGHTSVAKPWKSEAYVLMADIPHATLRHELVHAILAPYGEAPLGMPALFGRLIPAMGIVEGVAVAATEHAEMTPFTLEEWAAAMKRERLLPPPSVLSGWGFYAADGGAAYTAAGAFVLFLRQQYAPDALLSLYRGAPMRQVTGKSMRELTEQWHKHLDGIPVSAALSVAAQYRFDRQPIVSARCVREVHRLMGVAAQCHQERDDNGAIRHSQRAYRLSGHAEDIGLFHLRTLMKAQEPAQAHALADKLHRGLAPQSLRASLVAETLADLRAQGDASARPTHYPAPGHTDMLWRERSLAVKQHLARQHSPSHRQLLRAFIRAERGIPDTESTLSLHLHQTLQEHPQDVYVRYLLARQFWGAQQDTEALAHVDALLDDANDKRRPTDALLPAVILWELRFMKGKMAWRTHQNAEAAAIFSALADDKALPLGLRHHALDWLSRVRHSAEHPSDSRATAAAKTGD